MQDAINKTLIIRLSSIGDIILASPLVRLLRKAFPKTQIDFLVKTGYADLVRYNPHLSNIIAFDSRGGAEHLSALRRRIRRSGYDLIIDLQGNFRSSFVRSGNARQVMIVDKRRLARFLLVNFKWNLYNSAPPVALRYLETLSPWRVVDDGLGLEVFVPKETQSRIADRLAAAGVHNNENIVGLCPGAKHATKRWPLERFAELAAMLIREDNATVILFGGEDDRKRCDVIEQKVVEENGNRNTIANFAGAFSLLETAAAMDACDVVVSNDTGLLHLAAARKRKVAALFGPTVKEFGFFPYGAESRVIERSGLYCRPCTHIGGEACPEGHFRCMREVTVEAVLRGVRSFLPIAA